MKNDQNPEQDSVGGSGLDNWYGSPKSVGFRDIIIGVTFILVIIMTMMTATAINKPKVDESQTETIVCPHCHESFEQSSN